MRPVELWDRCRVVLAGSGGVEMRFSNDPAALESSRWEPLASEKAWPLDCQRDQVCTVFGQFADAANNESLVLAEHIRLEGVKVYLPMVVSNR